MTSKKAQAKTILPPLFDIIIAVIVFLAIMFSVMKINNNQAYNEQVYISTLGLGLQMIQALGNDINADRDITDAGSYHLFFEGTQVYIQERGAQGTTFLFTHSPDMRFFGGEFTPEKGKKTIGLLKLFKRGRNYGAARPENVPSPYLLTCDTNPGKPLKKIALDAGHDATDQGYTFASTNEAAYTLKLANALKAGRPRFSLTRDKEDPVSIENRQKTAGDALISLHVGSRTDDQDTVKAYYNPTPESKRLACEILNEIATKFNISVRPIPASFDYLPDNDPKQVLKGNKPAVLLEIGNAQKKDSILEEDSQLALQIYKGIEAYGVE